jgi:hypothetical protein
MRKDESVKCKRNKDSKYGHECTHRVMKQTMTSRGWRPRIEPCPKGYFC